MAEGSSTPDLDPAHIERLLGIKLLPWQRAYLDAMRRGQTAVMVGGRRAGRATLRRGIAAAQAEVGHRG